MTDDIRGDGGLADVIALNRRAYDDVAAEYDARAAAYERPNQILLAPILVYLRGAFGGRVLHGLDIGPGSGLDMAILQSEGVSMTGVELSLRMARVARRRAPDARVVVADFLSWDESGDVFDVIVSKACLHLFPARHAASYLTKCQYR